MLCTRKDSNFHRWFRRPEFYSVKLLELWLYQHVKELNDLRSELKEDPCPVFPS